MSSVQPQDILFRAGGAELIRTGAPFRRRRFNSAEPETYVHTRADASTCATYVDQDLTIRTAAANKLRCDWTGGIPSLLVESSRANVCLQSENFSLTWSLSGTGTCTNSAGTVGIVNLARLNDSTTTGLTFWSQNISFTGDGVKALSFFIGQGNSPPTSGSVIKLLDTIAGASRGHVVITWAGGYPVVSAASGAAVLATVTLYNGIFRVLMATATVIAANTNQLQVIPAGTTAETGDLLIGGVQAEDATYPTSYIKTTAAAITRAADSLYFPIGFEPCDLTIYWKGRAPSWLPLGIGNAAFFIGSSAGGNSNLAVSGSGIANQLWLTGSDGTSGLTASAATVANTTTPEICGQVANATSAAKLRQDVGNGFGAYSSAGTAMAVWGTNRIVLAGNLIGDAATYKMLILRGSFTLSECQAVAW